MYQHAMQRPSQGFRWQFFLQIGKQLYIHVHMCTLRWEPEAWMATSARRMQQRLLAYDLRLMPLSLA